VSLSTCVNYVAHWNAQWIPSQQNIFVGCILQKQIEKTSSWDFFTTLNWPIARCKKVWNLHFVHFGQFEGVKSFEKN